jgi:L-lactate dehydrogenase complex protein LldF
MTAPDNIKTALADSRLQEAIYAATARLMDHRKGVVGPEVLPDYQELRDAANAIKRHTIENLDYYLEQLEANLTRRGGTVVWCRDGEEVARFLVKLAQEKGARRVVKSKSMTTEEIDLNEKLEQAGIEAVETDLGEFIIQLLRQRPYHIVAPALHLTRHQVADVFSERLGVERETVIEKQTLIARRVLREKFLEADIGVSGANFLLAGSGTVVLCTNEGNARLTTTAPRIHVAIAGIEKVIPRAADLAVFLKLLGRSATGQPLTVYTSMLSGPRRESEIDGPEEFYLVLLDGGRTQVLADEEKRQSLYCIRCGACLNHCPVYRKIGGHNYPWVYSGPLGAVISPIFQGVMRDPWLPFASSLCGACGEVCPVKIELPKLLLEHRQEIAATRAAKGEDRAEKLAFRAWAWLMRHPKLYELAGTAGSAVSPEGGWLKSMPGLMNVGPAKAWTSQRDMPAVAERSFRQLWRERQARPREAKS